MKCGAVSLMGELGQLSRFDHPRQLMGYAGIVSREHSSGERIRRGAISKSGNAHLRRIAVEAAWAYRHRPAVGYTLAARQRRSSPAARALAWKAQHRLHQRYARLMARGKSKQHTVTAIGRELLGCHLGDRRTCGTGRKRPAASGGLSCNHGTRARTHEERKPTAAGGGTRQRRILAIFYAVASGPHPRHESHGSSWTGHDHDGECLHLDPRKSESPSMNRYPQPVLTGRSISERAAARGEWSLRF